MIDHRNRQNRMTLIFAEDSALRAPWAGSLDANACAHPQIKGHA